MTLTSIDTDHVLKLDREHLWHPYTSMTHPAPTRLVTGAHGVHLTLEGVGDVIDAMSSWWSAIHGYRHPELDAALTQQTGELAHVMFGGLTHQPAVGLARRLVDITPDGLQHVFLADSGSVSVEVALKMALQHQRGVGRVERTRFLTVHGGYHGDTCGCMSVCDPVVGMHSMFTGFLPRHLFAPAPPGPGEAVAEWARELSALADAHAHELAGIIVEPLLQGAGGMRPYAPACLQVMREVADRHGLALIFDEIATGFGRTGRLFVSGSEEHGITPDILCLGKALTGGYLTLAATLCTPAIAAGISASESGVLMHGPTFMGNPLACAVASASIDLLLSRGWKSDVNRIHDALDQGLAPLRGAPGVREVRTLGAVGVVQLDRAVDGPAATDAALAHGVWVRPFRDLIYTMPPYVATTEDVTTICTAIGAAVRAG